MSTASNCTGRPLAGMPGDERANGLQALIGRRRFGHVRIVPPQPGDRIPKTRSP